MVRFVMRFVVLLGTCLVVIGAAQPAVAAPEEGAFAHAVVIVAQADSPLVEPNPIIPATPRGAYVSFVALSCTPSPLIPTDPCDGFGAV